MPTTVVLDTPFHLRGFIGTAARSNSSPAYTSGVRRSAFPDRSPPGNTEEVCRFSCLQWGSAEVRALCVPLRLFLHSWRFMFGC